MCWDAGKQPTFGLIHSGLAICSLDQLLTGRLFLNPPRLPQLSGLTRLSALVSRSAGHVALTLGMFAMQQAVDAPCLGLAKHRNLHMPGPALPTPLRWLSVARVLPWHLQAPPC